MAAPIPQLQFYSDNYPLYTITNDFCDVAAATSSAGPLWGEEEEEETLVPLFHGFGLDQTSPYPHPHHQPEVVALPHHHELDNNMGGGGGGGVISSAGCQNLCLGYAPPPDNHFYEFGDQDSYGFGLGLVPRVKPSYHPLSTDNWEIQSNNQVPATDQDDPNNMTKVGRYSEEVRKERILRYLKKRNQRNFNKTIKYACRKTLADRRIRVRGRFARNNEACDQQLNPTKNNNNNDDTTDQSTQLLYNHHDLGIQMKKRRGRMATRDHESNVLTIYQ